MIDYTFAVSHDHSSLPGHFPGNPIVPGVVILQHVMEAARRYLDTTGGGRVCEVASAKFLRPLLPGQSADIRVERGRGDRLRFECRLRGGDAPILVSGLLRSADTIDTTAT